MSSGLVDRHIAFLEALRGAGLAVSLAEDLDAVAALSALPWDERATVHAAYAATLVKKQSQRPTFDALFDVYFPRLVGEGGPAEPSDEPDRPVRDNAQALADFRELLAEALADGDQEALARLAVEMVGRFGAMPGRGPGLSSWSAYTALQRVSPGELVDRIVAGAARRRQRPRRRPPGWPGGGSAASPARSRTTPAAGSPRRRGPTTSPTSRSGRASTGSTSPPRARRTWRRCAARSTRWPAGSRPGSPRSTTPAAAARSTSAAPCAPRSPPAAYRWSPTTAPSARTATSSSCCAT